MEPNGVALGSAPHETPLGRIIAGIGFLDRLAKNYVKSGYPDLTELQGQIGQLGNIAAKSYPKLDRIQTCRVVDPKKMAEEAEGKRGQQLWAAVGIAVVVAGMWAVSRWRRKKGAGGDNGEDKFSV